MNCNVTFFVCLLNEINKVLYNLNPTVNVAPRGRATQSAEPASAGTGPELAIDCYSNPTDCKKTCASVPTQDNPWWQLDLMSIYHITGVSVIGVDLCCPDQMDGAQILVGLGDDTNNQR